MFITIFIKFDKKKIIYWIITPVSPDSCQYIDPAMSAGGREGQGEVSIMDMDDRRLSGTVTEDVFLWTEAMRPVALTVNQFKLRTI